jgi:hypothetical protein
MHGSREIRYEALGSPKTRLLYALFVCLYGSFFLDYASVLCMQGPERGVHDVVLRALGQRGMHIAVLWTKCSRCPRA